MRMPASTLTFSSILLHIQVCPCLVDGASPNWVRCTRTWLYIVDEGINESNSGAQIVFRSLIQPVFSRYFSHSGSTAANLRSQADQATKPHAM